MGIGIRVRCMILVVEHTAQHFELPANSVMSRNSFDFSDCNIIIIAAHISNWCEMCLCVLCGVAAIYGLDYSRYFG